MQAQRLMRGVALRIAGMAMDQHAALDSHSATGARGIAERARGWRSRRTPFALRHETSRSQPASVRVSDSDSRRRLVPSQLITDPEYVDNRTGEAGGMADGPSVATDEW